LAESRLGPYASTPLERITHWTTTSDERSDRANEQESIRWVEEVLKVGWL
jgi:hypothetical protein